MRDYAKDLDGLAYWMLPAIIALDIAIFWLQQMILAEMILHEEDHSDA